MRTLTCVTMVVGSVACGGARPLNHAPRDPGAALVSLVEAERAFATLARDSGTRAAFLANMSDSGTLFRPTAVPARPWLQGTPPARSSALLAWEPRWAGVSRAGDLGFTTGPYEFRPRGASDTLVHRGTYVTVWGRERSGRWKALVDHGSPGPPLLPLSPSGRGEWTSLAERGAAPVSDPAALRAELLQLDSALGAAQDAGAPPRFLGRFDDVSRLHRAGSAPTIGAEAARLTAAENPGRWSSVPRGGGVAGSGDLGYTYGTYEAQPGGGRTDERGNYLRVWRRDSAGEWRITIDLAVALPPAP